MEKCTMVAKITKEVYIKRLVEKFGRNSLVGKFRGRTVATNHLCEMCNNTFLRSPSRSLSRWRTRQLCSPCTQKDMHNKQKVPEKEFRAKLQATLEHIKCISYVSNHKKGKFECLTCGNEWEVKPYELLKYKYGCPNCRYVGSAKSNTLSIDDIKKKLKLNNPYVTLVSKKRPKYEPSMLRFRCAFCKNVWTAHQGNVTNGQRQSGRFNGCPVCYSHKATPYGIIAKKVNLGHRTVSVVGYEPQAIDYLVSKRGVSPSKIHVFSEGTVPIIPYKFLGQWRSYWPDMLVGSTIVEVKSTYTLFVDWKRNTEKAKGSLAAGYKFRLIVVTEQKAVLLPKTWYLQDKDSVDVYIRTRSVSAVRVLALDPGTTNFGWSVLKIDRRSKPTVLAHGMLVNTIKTLTGNLREPIELFRMELLDIVQQYEVDFLAAERFMSRRLGGTLIELVGFMLGIAMGVVGSTKSFHKDGIKLITAAQWKNEWNKVSDLEAFYKTVDIPVHEVDSIGIGLYCGRKFMGIEPFKDMKDLEKRFQKQLQVVNSLHKKVTNAKN